MTRARQLTVALEALRCDRCAGHGVLLSCGCRLPPSSTPTSGFGLPRWCPDCEGSGRKDRGQVEPWSAVDVLEREA